MLTPLHRSGLGDKPVKQALLLHASGAYRYAALVLEDRWPEAEPLLAQSAIRGDWPGLRYYTDVIKRVELVPSMPNDLRRAYWKDAAAWGQVVLAGRLQPGLLPPRCTAACSAPIP